MIISLINLNGLVNFHFTNDLCASQKIEENHQISYLYIWNNRKLIEYKTTN